MSHAFALDKAKVKQAFSAASVTYDAFAELQRDVGSLLLSAFGFSPSGDLWLDLGCGTGFLTNELLSSLPGTDSPAIVALDIAWPMLKTARCKSSKHKVYYVCADAERLPILDASVDQVFSNLALQWSRNPDVLFADIKRIVKADGKLLFSTFGPQTLQELSSAWAEVDDYCHVNEFYSEEQLKLHLQQAGFRDIRILTKTYRPCYESVIDLMRQLKSIGAHNVTAGRNKKMTTKTQLQTMMTAYEKYRLDAGIPATFAAILVSAKA
jgi:malonyl-CoA O-methyltransferase